MRSAGGEARELTVSTFYHRTQTGGGWKYYLRAGLGGYIAGYLDRGAIQSVSWWAN